MSSHPPRQQLHPFPFIDIPPQPTASFNTLPLELRQHIWNLILLPRILCLHIHRRLAPPMVGRHGRYLDCPMRTVAVSFTCTVLTPPSSSSSSSSTNASPTADEIFSSFARKVAQKHKAENLDVRMGSLTCGPSALGPVGLYVCRESREIAKQRYELAFGGVEIDLDGRKKADWELRRPEDKAEWDRRQLSQKRIWVDFTRDIVFVDGHFRHELYAKCSPQEPLSLIRIYAPSEASKIKRLAIGAPSGNRGPYANEITTVIMGNRIYGRHEDSTLMLAPAELRREYLSGFDSVEELLIDDTVGAKDLVEYDPPRRNARSRLPWDESAVKRSILESLRGERQKGPYKGEIKLLEFVRGEGWNECLRC